MARRFYTNSKGKCVYIYIYSCTRVEQISSHRKLFYYYRVEVYGTTISKIAPTLNFLSSFRDKFLNSSIDRYYKLYNTLYIYIHEKLFNALNGPRSTRSRVSFYCWMRLNPESRGEGGGEGETRRVKESERDDKFSFCLSFHNTIESMRLGYKLSAWCEYLMNVTVNEARSY